MSNINTGTTNIPIPDNAYVRWRRSKILSYMTAWQQEQPKDYRNPTMREDEQNKEAVRMLTLIASLDYFIYDLIEEMESAGKFKQPSSATSTDARSLLRVPIWYSTDDYSAMSLEVARNTTMLWTSTMRLSTTA